MEKEKISSPFMTTQKKEAREFTETDYVTYIEKEKVSKDFDPDYPDEFTIEKEIVEFERVPISEEINSHRSKVGLKNLLKGIVDQRQMNALISKTQSTGGYFDATKLPDSHLAMEELAGKIDSIWAKIPDDLKGDLSKEEFIKTLTTEKLRKYVLDEVAKQSSSESEVK